jgi:hypothetical protein
VRAFDLSADADTAGAEDAAVVVESEALVRCIDGELGVAIGQTHVSEALLLGESLEFAMAVGDADGADVVALSEEKLKDVAAIFLKAFGVGLDIHAFEDSGDAGRKQLVGAGNLDHAETASADVAEAIEMAECRDLDVVFASDLQDGLSAATTDCLAVDDESFDVDGVGHASTS